MIGSRPVSRKAKETISFPDLQMEDVRSTHVQKVGPSAGVPGGQAKVGRPGVVDARRKLASGLRGR
jgi:hypothetical protein